MQDSAQGNLLNERGLKYLHATERGLSKQLLPGKTILVINSGHETEIGIQGKSWGLFIAIRKGEGYSPHFAE